MTSQSIILIFFALFVVAGLFIVSRPTSMPTQTITPTVMQPTVIETTTITPSPSETASHMVALRSFSFVPAEITIKKGEKVVWKNEDSAVHTVNSDLFDSPNMNQGDMFEFTFVNTGMFDYLCSLHPSMTGKVIVE